MTISGERLDGETVKKTAKSARKSRSGKKGTKGEPDEKEQRALPGTEKEGLEHCREVTMAGHPSLRTNILKEKRIAKKRKGP